YEIAKEVGIPNKDLIAKIRALGLEVNNHMSSLDADDVARIKRSLEKEKASVAAPQQTQKLSSGTVLRRRSSGDKAADSAPEERSVERAPIEPPAPAPTTRRRAVADESPAAIHAEPAAQPRTAPAAPRPVEPVVRPTPAVIVKPAPAPVESPPAPMPVPVVAQAPDLAPPSRETREPAPVTPPVVTPRVEVQASKPETNGTSAEAVARPSVESRSVVVPSAPVAPPVVEQPVVAAAANAQPARSRVILTGPQVVSRGGDTAQRSAGAATAERVIQHAQRPPVAPEPPPSTPLPPRVRQSTGTNGPEVTYVRPRTPTAEEVAGGARSRFELELERARARTAERPPSETPEEPVVAAPEPAPTAPRDPSRPAVGTVISLPPRIKITERTPMTGRPAPGPQPVNPIRGRFAQQQQRGGPRGPGGRPGSSDFGRKKLPLGKKGKSTTLTTPAEHKRVIRIEDTVMIGDLARGMGVKSPEVLKKLWGMGMTGVNINASIDFETAQLLASEFAYEVQNVAFKEDDIFAHKTDESEGVETRAPVVTVMGHVDHGKTSLLDAIRKTKVAAGESGGITQHVAAYKVASPGHGDIVFLDTPGHEAFTEMRARGAQATDIVVLVVAANDGVMPQTVEALSHAKDAKVTIIVAVNKCDMPDAAPDRVRQQLADHGLIPEEWGGDTIYVNVSALKGENIDKLLESIALSAEMLNLRATSDKPASGLVIEARLDRNRGPMATVLIQEGTLRVGDMLVAGRTFGKVRAMLDDRGQSLESAGPSTPIEVLGLDGVPDAGDQVNAAEDDKVAKQVVEHRRQQERKRELSSKGRVSLENLMERNSAGAIKELKIVLKADVQGSAEALKASLTKLSTDKVRVVVIATGVGGITESDVNLAKAGNAVIVGFHVRPAGKSSKLAEQENVEIRLYDIIYDALDEVKGAMAGLLAPIKREVAMGKLQVRETFSIPKMGVVAGCMVTDGKVTRKAHLRIIRDAVQVYEGKIGSLRRFKDDVSEVGNGYECGVMIAGWNELKVGDTIEAYEVIEEAAKL
ncbi:MAG: translation initiation factor, partial [Deltaproteobacteria bacterium]|nr:translation initiation factor [Deltaproteobacteria bacterium]